MEIGSATWPLIWFRPLSQYTKWHIEWKWWHSIPNEPNISFLYQKKKTFDTETSQLFQLAKWKSVSFANLIFHFHSNDDDLIGFDWDWIGFVTSTIKTNLLKSIIIKWWTGKKTKIKFDPNNDDGQIGQNGSNTMKYIVFSIIKLNCLNWPNVMEWDQNDRSTGFFPSYDNLPTTNGIRATALFFKFFFLIS